MAKKSDKTDEANINEATIFTAMADEHKYTAMLVSVLKDQLAEYDIGKKPDYTLMLEVAEYMTSFPKKFNHKRKDKLIALILKKEPSATELEDMMAERNELSELNKQVIQSLKVLIKEHTILQQEQLKVFSKNFVELVESHIAIEIKMLMPKAKKLLSQDELKQFDHDEDELDFSANIEERYKHLTEDINKRLEDFEGAANDFALAEFVSLSAFFESIEPLALGVHEISQIVKDYSYKVFSNNRGCYSDIITKKQKSRSDYIEKPLNCALDCYEDYVDGMSKIAEVLRKTKKEIYEPYQSRKAFFESNTDQDIA